MSWAATGFVKKLRQSHTGEPITKAEKLVLFVLADYHNEDRGDAWASLRHLANESLSTPSGLVRTLRSLEEKGILRIIRPAGTNAKQLTNRYQFVGLDCPAITPVDNPALADQPGQQGVDPRSTGVLTPGQQGVDPRSTGVLTPGQQIFPKNLSKDLSKDSLSGLPPDGAPMNLWITAEGILEFLNRKTGKRFPARHPNKDPTKSLRMVYALLKRGYTEQQVRQVVGNRLVRWEQNVEMREYLRPKTLFGPENFEQYLGQVGAST
jgi:uncharacterized phage protein (TIGR02220 family)